MLGPWGSALNGVYLCAEPPGTLLHHTANMSLSKAFGKMNLSGKTNYRYGPWEYQEVDADGKPLKNKKCKLCYAECTYRELIESWRDGHTYHDAACYQAFLEMRAANEDSEQKALLDEKIANMDNDTYENYATLRGYLICLDCELFARQQEWLRMSAEEQARRGDLWPTLDGVKRDANKARKGKIHENRGRMHAVAIQKVDEMRRNSWGQLISQNRRKAMINEETRRLTNLLHDKIRGGGLLKAFTQAGTRIEANAEIQERLNDAYEVYMADPTNEEKLKKFEDIECELYKTVRYTAFNGDGRMLYLADYCNQMDDKGQFKIFDLCRAHKGCGGTCGIYMPAHYWSKPSSQHRWYCKVDWAFACQHDSGLESKLLKMHGSLDDINAKMLRTGGDPCCGARYWPWKKGESQVVEIELSDPVTQRPETFCFMAARLPQELDDEIKNHTGQWMLAAKNLSDEEILQSLPKVYPCAKNLVNGDLLPGVGRFPVDQWIKDGRPILDAAGWCALCLKIKAKDTQSLSGIFDLGESLESQTRRAEKGERAGVSSACL